MSELSLRDALTEHIARRHWEHGQGGRWDRPADAPLAPFPAYASDQDKAQYRAYARELLSGFDIAAHPADNGVDSSLHICPGCGVKVVGHERCGDPTRPECAS